MVLGCGGTGGAEPERTDEGTTTREAASATTEGGLTEEQLQKGIGPVTRVELGPVQEALARKGEELFAGYCAGCHALDNRLVGPPLRDVTHRRAPEFVMNMMLNPAEMVEKHPEIKGMLGEYYTPMPYLGVQEEEARAILEYLREIAP